MSTRATAARHVRQRKLNTKQALRIIREDEIEDVPEDESQRNMPQMETGVEKGEEIEYHLQAVISAANAAALGANTLPNYIPTPDATKAKGVQYDELYPKVFKEPATYIRFSSTVEDSIGVLYCMNDDDIDFLGKLNEGKDVDGRDRHDSLGHCSEDTFEEAMNFLEETSARVQPFATVDNAPILSLDEMEHSVDENLPVEAQKWLKPIYQYWVSRKANRPLMPAIKVRVLDTTSEADDADPYVCFRRREVRQTRKTRGRDAQIVEKLKKLRLELESARSLVQLVVQREKLNKENLEVSRKLFDERRKLKDVKISKNIVGEKGDDEELLVNQKPVGKPKAKQDVGQQRPPPLRLRSTGDRSGAPDNDLALLSDHYAEAEAYVNNNIETRKEQHKKWNLHWVDQTWSPITPPPEETADQPPKWAPLLRHGGYPSPPPSLASRESPKEDGDVEMQDQPPPHDVDADAMAGASPEPDLFVFSIPGAYPMSPEPEEIPKRSADPVCRLRYGRGGRCHLESRKRRLQGLISSGVVSDSDSDDENALEYYPGPERITFDYRCALNNRARPDSMGAAGSAEKRHWGSGDQSAMAQAAGHAHPASGTPHQTTSGSAGS